MKRQKEKQFGWTVRKPLDVRKRAENPDGQN